jgi:hypothetical protein
VQTPLSSPVVVTLQVENIHDLASGGPIKIKFDPSQLRLNDMVAGDLFSRDGVRATSVKDIRNDSGEATLNVSRLPGSPPISGTGPIAVLNFVAVGKGSSTVTVVDAGLKSTQGQPLTVKLAPLPVTVQ